MRASKDGLRLGSTGSASSGTKYDFPTFTGAGSIRPSLAILLSVFSVLALILASIGIFGVLSYSVGQRSKEIALRRAIGATGSQIGRAVVGDGLKLTVIGAALGVAGAFASTRLIQGFLFQVDTHDPATFTTVSAILLLVAFAATAIPALRATRKSPRDALSGE